MNEGRIVELVGGPANGKRVTIPSGVQHLVVPVLDRSEPFTLPDTFQMEVDPETGRMTPVIEPLPISKVIYRKAADGRFEFAGADS